MSKPVVVYTDAEFSTDFVVAPHLKVTHRVRDQTRYWIHGQGLNAPGESFNPARSYLYF